MCLVGSVRRELVINYVISNNVCMRMEVGANAGLMVPSLEGRSKVPYDNSIAAV